MDIKVFVKKWIKDTFLIALILGIIVGYFSGLIYLLHISWWFALLLIPTVALLQNLSDNFWGTNGY